MKFKQILRYALFYMVVLFVLVLAKEALTGAWSQSSHSLTVGQYVQTVVQVFAGVLCVLVVFTRFFMREWERPVSVIWTYCLVLTAGLSGLVWGPPMPHTAALFAVLAYLVARGIRWAFEHLP